ncbi:hypothetical protein ACSNOH_01365 [Streptomyces sp. URMC 127]|uniref:hypothetical protein n=1 Tax=Streptomyces sp. URMC 127 TaxID=3423402 RepID=UPI003F1AC090
MSGLRDRESQNDKIDISHPFRATVALLLGALIPPAAILLAGHDAASSQSRPAPIALPDHPLDER